MTCPEIIRDSFKAISIHVAKKEQEITELDAVIGDGDHGFAVNRGFQAVCEAVDKLPADTDASALMKTAGMTLLSAMGGSAGPLYATCCLEIAKALAGKEAPTLADWAAGARSGIEGICRRGKSERGQKTMLDAMFPALEALEAAAAAGKSGAEALSLALAGAREGRDATANMVAARGRASYLGERSLGHPDAGAAMICVLLEAINAMGDDLK